MYVYAAMSYNSLVQTNDCEAMVMYATSPVQFDGWMKRCGTNVSQVFALPFTANVGKGCQA
jgi:hypothetical protein